MNSISADPAATDRPLWELVRCSNPECTHEHPRRADGRLALACHVCGSEMRVLALTVVDDAAPEMPLTLAGLAVALRAAAARCYSMAPNLESPGVRANYLGRASAYHDAALMAESVRAAREITG